jgi:hypothetical protein
MGLPVRNGYYTINALTGVKGSYVDLRQCTLDLMPTFSYSCFINFVDLEFDGVKGVDLYIYDTDILAWRYTVASGEFVYINAHTGEFLSRELLYFGR